MLTYVKQIWNSKDLRNRIGFTILMILAYRFIAHITVPGADMEALKAIQNRNELLQVFSLLTGGSSENFSIVLMGISPYINASIIMQLLTVISPKLESLSKEGESGRRKINTWTRWLTFPLAFLQSYGMILLLNSQAQLPILSSTSDPAVMLPVMLSISAGTVLLVWLGEQITENGVGNGISMIIFASIISQIPATIGQNLFLAQNDESRLIPFIAIVLLTIILMVIVVLVNEGQRRVPVTYAGHGVKGKNGQSFLPIRINQAGMIPIIFAVALMSFPGILAQFLVNANSQWLQDFGSTLTTLFSPNNFSYLVFYFLLVVAFTFFYVSITFNPDEIADSIQKRGGYIPGIRPGKQTTDYLQHISNRLTLFGSFFLGIIAILPLLLQFVFSSASVGSVTLLISGAGIIIIVGVVLELIRQINAMLVMHDYKKFY
ncbi:preprotein translocase subunit SecY [Candidatus Peregrinibacteria bacterium CG10_big_fil_rev_8_21_14_0_10_36_19]|nr:MAG: preprotein translocase subunit SecY [Candidatus Peregrinibacteria bacterium CG10_big_fil_rev_8_21_14_0_10_36_19]